MNAHSTSDKTLFDFQCAAANSEWQIVNDDVMGGVSTARFELSGGVAVFAGAVSLKNNGGFTSVRSPLACHSLGGSDGFVIRLRGDGLRYRFTVRTAIAFDTPLYQCAFVAKGGVWEEVRLSFRDFVPTFRGRVLADVPPLDPAKAASFGFLIADKQDGPFQLEIAWVRARTLRRTCEVRL